MKNLKKFILFIALLVFISSVSSCDYLDVVPDNIATIDYAFRNRTEAEKYLFTCYSYRPAIGSVNDDPAMNGGDETWQFYSQAFGAWNNSRIARGGQNVVDPILNYWDGSNVKSLWQGIRVCNIFLENIDKAHDVQQYERKRWIAEVKFLKAYYHYHLFKCYGPIPIVDVNLPVSASPDEVKVFREPVDEVVDYIVATIDDAIQDLPDASQIIQGIEAGRIDKLIALSMKAEVLLWAASPLFNGNSDYAHIVDKRGVILFPEKFDISKWERAATACKAAIDECHLQGKGLFTDVPPEAFAAPDPLQIETVIRQTIGEKWNKELIFGNTNNDCGFLAKTSQAKILRVKSETLNEVRTEWAPTIKMAEMFYSSNGVPVSEDIEWKGKGWYDNRFKIRPEPSVGNEKYYVKEGQKTVYLHYNREPRFYANLGFDRGIYFGNGYYDFNTNVRWCESINLEYSGFQGGAPHSVTGYSVKKMHSFKNALTAERYTVEYFPFPIMRLANLYLMYAEALNEFSGPGDEVYNYIDLVRKRAGLKGVKESWANYSNRPDKPDTKEGLRDIIQCERAIELAFEGKRFYDLRRWKKIEELNIQPLGWTVRGETAEDFYKVIPVAQEPVSFTAKDYLWPIKEDNLIKNNNLVQNYGW